MPRSTWDRKYSVNSSLFDESIPSLSARISVSAEKTSECSPANVLHSISIAESQPPLGFVGFVGFANERHNPTRQISFHLSTPRRRLIFMRISRLFELILTVSTGGFMVLKVS